MKSIIEPQTKRVIDTLLSENYQVQQYRSDFCFQFMALKHINLLIKMSYNIDAIRQYILNQLRLISKLLPSLPLIIGEKNKTASLEDENIYLRGNIFAMNFNTFRKILSESAFSYIYAQRGRYVVEIDGDKLREIREQNNMKTSDLAGLVGVSAKAIEQYEKNQTNVKLEVMEKMENTFERSSVPRLWVRGVGKLNESQYRCEITEPSVRCSMIRNSIKTWRIWQHTGSNGRCWISNAELYNCRSMF